MAKELQSAFLKMQRAEQTKATQVPAEMQAIQDRIERLRVRLRDGDPDLAPDELEAALAKAEEKRHLILTARPSTDGARAIAMLPGSAEEFREQIKQGLAGDVAASLKARLALRQYFGGQIKMLPGEDGGLYAEYLQHRIAPLQGVGTYGGRVGIEPTPIDKERASRLRYRNDSRTSLSILRTLHLPCTYGKKITKDEIATY
jgi:hypothetical protein